MYNYEDNISSKTRGRDPKKNYEKKNIVWLLGLSVLQVQHLGFASPLTSSQLA
jgi:hypothetical protein